MENKAKKATIPFLTSKFYLKDLYGISMNEEDFIEKAMIVLREISTYNIDVFTYDVTLEDDFIIDIPHGNIHNIESVSYIPASDALKEVSFLDDNLSKRQTTGDYVTYQLLDDNTIKVTNESVIGKTVRVIFTGLIEDTDNLPMLNMKQAKAIASKVAYMDLRKRAYMGDPTVDGRLMQQAQVESSRYIAAAKVPERLTDNDLDKICNTQTSHNRKVYGQPLKFTR